MDLPVKIYVVSEAATSLVEINDLISLMSLPIKADLHPTFGVCLYAVRDFHVGETIFEEKPLIRIEDRDSQQELMQWQLNNYQPSLKLFNKSTIAHVMSVKDMRYNYELLTKITTIPAKKIVEWLTVWALNFINLNELYSGLFVIASKLQHSCSPNSAHDPTDPHCDYLKLLALKPIKKGDLLTTSCIEELNYPRQLRWAKLFDEKLMIDCRCERCSGTDDVRMFPCPNAKCSGDVTLQFDSKYDLNIDEYQWKCDGCGTVVQMPQNTLKQESFLQHQICEVERSGVFDDGITAEQLLQTSRVELGSKHWITVVLQELSLKKRLNNCRMFTAADKQAVGDIIRWYRRYFAPVSCWEVAAKIYPYLKKNLLDREAVEAKLLAKMLYPTVKNMFKDMAVVELKRLSFDLQDKICENCQRNDDKCQLCGRCKMAFYCTKKCQKADWEQNHKHLCKQLRQLNS